MPRCSISHWTLAVAHPQGVESSQVVQTAQATQGVPHVRKRYEWSGESRGPGWFRTGGGVLRRVGLAS